MHRSRLCGVVIDSQVDPAVAVGFWSAALGKKASQPDPEEKDYRQVDMREDEPIVLVQRVDHPPRVHIDIETDDIEAEVKRLEKLGAKTVSKPRGGRWTVMEAPTGHRFCVVRPQRGPLEGKPNVNEWP